MERDVGVCGDLIADMGCLSISPYLLLMDV